MNPIMTEIMIRVEQIKDELHDAKTYIKQALEAQKAKNDDDAAMYFAMSNEEMGHFERLHKSVERLIEKYRDKYGEPPAEMLMRYKIEHEQWIEKADKVKSMQRKYKEM